MEELIQQLKGLDPAVACTVVIVGGAVIGVAIWQYFKFLRSM